MSAREPITTHAVPARSNTFKTATAWVIAICAALLLGSAGVGKVLSVHKLLDFYDRAGQPHWVFYGSGIIETICSLGLLAPRMRLYSAWGLLTMIFLIAWSPWLGHEKSFLIPQCVAISMLIVLVWPLKAKRQSGL
jgi:uncharacterized membrane protein YphA (DoxX/SURF4 family)